MWSIQSSIFYLLWPTFFKNRGTGFCARFYCSECPKSPYFSMVLRDSKYQVLLRYARMCNRFEITRNQVVRKGTWVRIPPAAPRRSKVRFAPTFFYSCGTKERHPPAPLLLLSNRDPQRSRWRLCRLTDAACPLRVLRWARGRVRGRRSRWRFAALAYQRSRLRDESPGGGFWPEAQPL